MINTDRIKYYQFYETIMPENLTKIYPLLYYILDICKRKEDNRPYIFEKVLFPTNDERLRNADLEMA